MKTSDSIKAISAALLAAQRQITFAPKNAVNPHFKNTYADLSEVIHAIKGALNDNGIVFLQSGSPPIDSDDFCLHLTTRLVHAESGEWIEDELAMPLARQDPQGYGSAMTYARRYSLAAITGLYQDDDDGEAASQAKAPAQAPAAARQRPAQAPQQAQNDDMLQALLDEAAEVSAKGTNNYRQFWTSLSAEEKQMIGAARHEDFKTLAAFNSQQA